MQCNTTEPKGDEGTKCSSLQGKMLSPACMRPSMMESSPSANFFLVTLFSGLRHSLWLSTHQHSATAVGHTEPLANYQHYRGTELLADYQHYTGNRTISTIADYKPYKENRTINYLPTLHRKHNHYQTTNQSYK